MLSQKQRHVARDFYTENQVGSENFFVNLQKFITNVVTVF